MVSKLIVIMTNIVNDYKQQLVISLDLLAVTRGTWPRHVECYLQICQH